MNEQMNNMEIYNLFFCFSIGLLLFVGNSFAYDPATCIQCRESHMCNPPDCFCCRDKMPLKTRDIPQMVFFSFDDAVNPQVAKYYRQLFSPKRRNPNGCPISMTLFVSHRNTVYSLVKEFYRKGIEIASHSVTHSHMNTNTFIREARKQKENLSKRAGIPSGKITGWRSPFLEPVGDLQPSVLKDLGYEYDATLTMTKKDPKDKAITPFTLDFGWPYDCNVKPCPAKTHKGFWEVPVVSVKDYLNKYDCVYVDGCNNPPPTENLAYKFLWDNFQKYYTTNRAPMGINMHASWFYYPDRKAAMDRFIKQLGKLDDVYIVSIKQVIEWLKDPKSLNQIKTFPPWQCNGNKTTETGRKPSDTRQRSRDITFRPRNTHVGNFISNVPQKSFPVRSWKTPEPRRQQTVPTALPDPIPPMVPNLPMVRFWWRPPSMVNRNMQQQQQGILRRQRLEQERLRRIKAEEEQVRLLEQKRQEELRQQEQARLLEQKRQETLRQQEQTRLLEQKHQEQLRQQEQARLLELKRKEELRQREQAKLLEQQRQEKLKQVEKARLLEQQRQEKLKQVEKAKLLEQKRQEELRQREKALLLEKQRLEKLRQQEQAILLEQKRQEELKQLEQAKQLEQQRQEELRKEKLARQAAVLKSQKEIERKRLEDKQRMHALREQQRLDILKQQELEKPRQSLFAKQKVTNIEKLHQNERSQEPSVTSGNLLQNEFLPLPGVTNENLPQNEFLQTADITNRNIHKIPLLQTPVVSNGKLLRHEFLPAPTNSNGNLLQNEFLPAPANSNGNLLQNEFLPAPANSNGNLLQNEFLPAPSKLNGNLLQNEFLPAPSKSNGNLLQNEFLPAPANSNGNLLQNEFLPAPSKSNGNLLQNEFLPAPANSNGNLLQNEFLPAPSKSNGHLLQNEFLQVPGVINDNLLQREFLQIPDATNTNIRQNNFLQMPATNGNLLQNEFLQSPDVKNTNIHQNEFLTTPGATNENFLQKEYLQTPDVINTNALQNEFLSAPGAANGNLLQNEFLQTPVVTNVHQNDFFQATGVTNDPANPLRVEQPLIQNSNFQNVKDTLRKSQNLQSDINQNMYTQTPPPTTTINHQEVLEKSFQVYISRKLDAILGFRPNKRTHQLELLSMDELRALQEELRNRLITDKETSQQNNQSEKISTRSQETMTKSGVNIESQTVQNEIQSGNKPLLREFHEPSNVIRTKIDTLQTEQLVGNKAGIGFETFAEPEKVNYLLPYTETTQAAYAEQRAVNESLQNTSYVPTTTTQSIPTDMFTTPTIPSTTMSPTTTPQTTSSSTTTPQITSSPTTTTQTTTSPTTTTQTTTSPTTTTQTTTSSMTTTTQLMMELTEYIAERTIMEQSTPASTASTTTQGITTTNMPPTAAVSTSAKQTTTTRAAAATETTSEQTTSLLTMTTESSTPASQPTVSTEKAVIPVKPMWTVSEDIEVPWQRWVTRTPGLKNIETTTPRVLQTQRPSKRIQFFTVKDLKKTSSLFKEQPFEHATLETGNTNAMQNSINIIKPKPFVNVPKHFDINGAQQHGIFSGISLNANRFMLPITMPVQTHSPEVTKQTLEERFPLNQETTSLSTINKVMQQVTRGQQSGGTGVDSIQQIAKNAVDFANNFIVTGIAPQPKVSDVLQQNTNTEGIPPPDKVWHVSPTLTGRVRASGECIQEVNCMRPNCVCKGTNPMAGIKIKDTPQIVYITIDGSLNFHTYGKLRSLFSHQRKNPNGCRITGTVFITDTGSSYRIANVLKSGGIELAMMGVSSRPYTDSAKLKTDLIRQRKRIAASANIAPGDVLGWRSPGLSPLGEEQYSILANQSLYDSSLLLPTNAIDSPISWPYTLDFGWKDTCQMGKCPTEYHSGLWEVPAMPFNGPKNLTTCEYIDACTNQPETEQETIDYLMNNFNKHYKTNRAPFAIRLKQMWFHWYYRDNFSGLLKFLDKILRLGDVYITSISDMLEWMKAPKSLKDLKQFDKWKC